MLILQDSVKELWYASPTNLTYDERNFDGSYNPKSGFVVLFND